MRNYRVLLRINMSRITNTNNRNFSLSTKGKYVYIFTLNNNQLFSGGDEKQKVLIYMDSESLESHGKSKSLALRLSQMPNLEVVIATHKDLSYTSQADIIINRLQDFESYFLRYARKSNQRKTFRGYSETHTIHSEGDFQDFYFSLMQRRIQDYQNELVA